jgi:uncharacterized protein YciI
MVMKKSLISFLVFTFYTCSIFAQAAEEKYDSVLAKKLQADEYGMKYYVFVLLKTGSNKSVDKTTRDSLFHGHLNNIGRLADEGKLVVAGPFGENNSYRGLFILNVTSLDEAKKLLQTDPAINAKLLEPEMYLWYGSASLQEVPEAHKKIQKSKF